MTFTDMLKATDRSLKLAITRVAVRIGALLVPARTAEFIARRFFTTARPPMQRMRFSASEPTHDRLQTPDGELMTYRWGDVDRDPTVVLVHGWNGWAQQMERFITPLRQRGFAVLAFDHVAHGASAGNRSSLPAMIRTVEHIFSVVPNPAGVIGHSLGAAAAASVLASSRRQLLAAVLIAPPSDPRPYLTMVARVMGAPKKLMPLIQQVAERIAGVDFKRLVADPWTVRRIRTPLMIVHDVNDDEVPISNGYAYTVGTHARMLATDGLGHRRILRDLHVVDEATDFLARCQPMLAKQRTPIAA